jgi:gamma-glutamyl hydrolase
LHGKNFSYVGSSYVKFIEQAGARVVPIPYDADEATLESIFKSINGILLCGGSTALRIKGGSPTPYSKAVAYMFNRATEVNDAGTIFPILGICHGHQLLHYILTNFRKVTHLS